MVVSLFGLGYVGCVTAACLSRDGVRVIGVDVNPDKVAAVRAGKSPILEADLEDLIRASVASGRLTVTHDGAEAVRGSDLSLISVGTPSGPDGRLDLSHVHAVCREIGRAVAAKGSAHAVALRSTVPPGTTRACAEILREEAGDTPVAVAFNPEFLREGTAIRDYDDPPYTLIGCDDPAAEQALRELYAALDAPLLVVLPEEAEMLKAVSNAWHAAKIVFANEIGRLAKAMQLDGRRVMDLIRRDTKLNISAMYLAPGFAYGGSCLPKDVRSLLANAREADVRVPMLESLDASNAVHLDAAARQILALGRTRIGLVGLAFKPGTDDLRESPAISLANRLLEEGLDLLIYDEAIHPETLISANLRYANEHLPRLPELLAPNPEALLAHAEVLVLTHRSAPLRALVEQADPSVPVIDLAGLYQAPPCPPRRYAGSCW